MEACNTVLDDIGFPSRHFGISKQVVGYCVTDRLFAISDTPSPRKNGLAQGRLNLGTLWRTKCSSNLEVRSAPSKIWSIYWYSSIYPTPPPHPRTKKCGRIYNWCSSTDPTPPPPPPHTHTLWSDLLMSINRSDPPPPTHTHNLVGSIDEHQ